MRVLKTLLLGAAVLTLAAGQLQADILIDAGIGAGNGDFNYNGGAVGIPATLTVTENIPRDRALVGVGNNPGQGIDFDGWTILRVTYSGANNAFGLDGNFGFDDASHEAANTGSGQLFQNGNVNATIDAVADQIAATGIAGDVFDLTYLLGSDSAGGNSIATLTLDAGLATQQVQIFGSQSRSGTSRTGANSIAETYTSTGAYSTVDLTLRLGNETGSTRVLVDDLRLERTLATVPEPGSMALLGLAGLAGFIRRRR